MTKLAYFHPRLNFPPLYGSQVYSWEILKQLQLLGFEIHLFLLESSNEVILDKESHWGFNEVYIIPMSPDKKSIREKFTQYLLKVKPDVIFINYASCDYVLDHRKFKGQIKVMCNHHFESLRSQMIKTYTSRWNKVSPKTIDDLTPELYNLDFFNNKALKPTIKEYKIYNRYDFTLAMEDIGMKLIEANCPKTKVLPLRATISQFGYQTNYAPSAILPVGPNCFNIQGYSFFIKQVLPLIISKNPFFRVKLTGVCSSFFIPSSHVICKGFHDNLYDEYCKSRFLICPIFSGTGQQIKIIEAMSCALAVVAMDNPLQHIPIIHGINGFIAKNAQEFAQYCLILFNDEKLAKVMGQKAKRHIKKNYHSKRMQEILNALKMNTKSYINYNSTYGISNI